MDFPMPNLGPNIDPFPIDISQNDKYILVENFMKLDQ